MKRTLFTILPLLLLSATGWTQVSVETTSGISTEVSGGLQLSLDGNWTNNGTLTAGTGTILLNGSGLQTITNASGAFHNLTINKPSGDAQAASNFTVDGTMTLSSGDVDLNGNVITLGTSALLAETAGNTVKGGAGYLETTRDLNAPSSDNVGGLGFEITSTANLGSTVIQRGHTAQSGNGNTSILRYFDVTPTNNCDLNATLVYRYDDSELAGQIETALQLYKSHDGGNTWSAEGGTADGSGNTVTLTGIHGFSRWTAADQSLAPPPIPLNFVFIANDSIEIDRNEQSSGDIQSNYGSIQFHKGAPGQHTGSLFAGQDIVIDKQNTIIGDAQAGNEILLANGANITGSQTDHAPINVIVVPTPSFSACGPDITVDKNGSLTLPPGTYSDVTVDARGKLYLSAGVYYMNALNIDASATIYLDVSGGEVKVNVVSMLQFIRQATVEVTGGGTEQATFTTLQSDTLYIEQSSMIRGTLIAPNAHVYLERASAFTGTLYADKIRLDPNAKFQPHGSSALLSKSGGMDESSGASETADADREEELTSQSIPDSYGLEQNYPNPFNPTTVIRFALPEAASVKLEIYNLLGQKIRTLVSGEMQAGYHTMQWDARNDLGQRVPSGMYLYRLQAGSEVNVMRMTLMK